MRRKNWTAALRFKYCKCSTNYCRGSKKLGLENMGRGSWSQPDSPSLEIGRRGAGFIRQRKKASAMVSYASRSKPFEWNNDAAELE
jgi:hypothetical protein